MNILTWNIRHGLGNDDHVDLDRVIDVLRDTNADLVALQEVDRFWRRSGNQDQPEVLATALDMNAAFGANFIDPASGGKYGTLILSRYPITASENHPYPVYDGFEPRALLSATIDTPFGAVHFFNTHLQVGSPTTESEAATQRHEQAGAIVQRVDASRVPVILSGDFNATPDSAELASIRDRLTDCWLTTHQNEPGYTIPAHSYRSPTKRIDMIHVSPAFRVTACRVIDTPISRLASDHFPVLASLTMRETLHTE